MSVDVADDVIADEHRVEVGERLAAEPFPDSFGLLREFVRHSDYLTIRTFGDGVNSPFPIPPLSTTADGTVILSPAPYSGHSSGYLDGSTAISRITPVGKPSSIDTPAYGDS